MAGRRGKCPKCQKSIDVPSAPSKSDTAIPPPTLTSDQVATTLREACAQLKSSVSSPATTAALVCRIVRGVHYLLPLIFGGATAYHFAMNSSWASDAQGTPGALVFWALLASGIVLTVMALLSHIAPPQAKLPAATPLDPSKVSGLHSLIDDLAKRLNVPTPKLVAVWDETLTLSNGELRIGASLLSSLSAAEVASLVARELALERAPGRRVARAEFVRLRRAVGEDREGLAKTAGARVLALLGVLGRPIVWPLMVLVRLVSEAELRQAELDADALQCELVGSRQFLTTLQRRRLVAYAVEMATADLPFQFQDKSLRANRIRTVEENLQTLPAEVQQSLLEQPVDDPPAGDYRPTWRERITAAQKLAAPGVLQCPASARLLVADFEELCRDVTWLDASGRFGPKLKRRELVVA
jgi:hypothetical protein